MRERTWMDKDGTKKRRWKERRINLNFDLQK